MRGFAQSCPWTTHSRAQLCVICPSAFEPFWACPAPTQQSARPCAACRPLLFWPPGQKLEQCDDSRTARGHCPPYSGANLSCLAHVLYATSALEAVSAGRRIPSPCRILVCGGLRVRAWLSALVEACWGAGQGPELRATLHRSGSYSSRHVPGLLCDQTPQLSARQFAQLALVGDAVVVCTRANSVSVSPTLLIWPISSVGWEIPNVAASAVLGATHGTRGLDPAHVTDNFPAAIRPRQLNTLST
jgi:hypothetical protein